MRERVTSEPEKFILSMPDKCIPDKVPTNGEFGCRVYCPREHPSGRSTHHSVTGGSVAKYGGLRGNNPGKATGLEWQIRLLRSDENFSKNTIRVP